MDKKQVTAVVGVAALVAVGGALVATHGHTAKAASAGPLVETTQVTTNSTSSDVVAEGATVSHAIANVDLQAGMTGTVSEVLADVGQHVEAGQVLCVVDAVDTQNKLTSANANLAAAQASYQLVLNPHRPEEVEQAQLRVSKASQAIDEAQQRLALLQAGARPLEVTEAQDAVDQAQQRLATAQAQDTRNQSLFNQELLPKADLEISDADVADAKSMLDDKQSALALLKQGARTQEIAAAQDSLTEAKIDQQDAQSAYKLLMAGSRPEEIEASADHLKDAEANVQEDQLVYSRREVRAPISGTITARNVNIGEIATPGSVRTSAASPSLMNSTSLFVISGDNDMEFMSSVDQMFFKSLHIGQPVSIGVEALPGRTFPGKIDRIAPAISYSAAQSASSPLTFTVWAKLPNVATTLEPGQIGVMRASHNDSGLVIPEAALTPFTSGEGIVYTVTNGAVHPVKVRYKSIVDGTVHLLSGLTKGQTVVMSPPPDLSDGEQVRVDGASGSGTTGSGSNADAPLLQ